MKILPITLLIVLSTLTSLMPIEPPKPQDKHPQHQASPALKGYIQAPKEWEKVPEFRIFFEGKQTMNNKEGFYSLPIENKNINKYSVLISKNFNQNFENLNTIENLSVEPEKSYKYFSFKKTGTHDSWQATEKKLDKKDFVIPPNCLIISMNPKYVESIENWNITLSRNFLKLPKIILKKDIKEKRVKRESAKSLLYSLDAKVFHETIKESKKIFFEKPQTLVSLAQ